MFLVNKLDHALTLKKGYLVIPAGGSVPITEEDLKDSTVADAISRSWAETSDKATEATVIPAIKTVSPVEASGGMTEAEMKAELAARNKGSEITSETIGLPPVIEVENLDAPVAEVVTEVAAETTPTDELVAPTTSTKKSGNKSK